MTKLYPSFCGHIPPIPENFWKQVCGKSGVRWDYDTKDYVFQTQRVQKPENGDRKPQEICTMARFYNFSYAYMKEQDFQKALERVKHYEDGKGNPIYLPAYLPKGETYASYAKLMKDVEKSY